MQNRKTGNAKSFGTKKAVFRVSCFVKTCWPGLGWLNQGRPGGGERKGRESEKGRDSCLVSRDSGKPIKVEKAVLLEAHRWEGIE